MSGHSWDEAAEKSLVGAAMLDAGVLDNVAIRPEHFGNLVWRCVWESLKELHELGKPLDILVVSDNLRSRGAPDHILVQLSQAVADVPTATNADYYAEIIRDHWLSREVEHLAAEIQVGDKSGRELVNLLDSRVSGLLIGTGSRLPTLEAVIDDELEALEHPVQVGLPSGVGLEGVVPGGIPTDRVTTIFGESGSFKSTVKNAIVHAIASAGHVVVDCSFEDSNSLTAARWISRDTGIPYGELAARQRRVVSHELASKAAAGRVIAAGDMPPTVEEVIRVARQYKRLAKAKAVVVDYIQLLEGSGNERENLAEAMRKFQILAKRENLAVILVSQVKQDQGLGGAYARKDPRPIMHDCLGSSAIRTATKLGVGVFRPFHHCKAPTDQDGPYGLYVRMRDLWPDGREAFDRVYPEFLELVVAKQVAGASPVSVMCRVKPETGVIVPFNPERYL